jgi:hypothetical protein
MPLENIRMIMGRRDFAVLAALQRHREKLHRRIAQLERIIDTVDETILFLEGKKEMSKRQFFDGFSEEQQAQYEKEATEMYDPAIVKASNQRWRNYTAAEKQHIFDEGNAVYEDMLQAMPKGASSSEAQAAVERWRRHMEYFWVPNDDQLLGSAFQGELR